MVTGPSGSRAQVALAFLRTKITSGEWPVNSRIPTEPELMELIGVGRGTVREAVRSLASVGMLESMVSRGTYVRSRLPVSNVLADFVAGYDLEDILGFRRALEVDAAFEAATRRTDAQLEAMRAALAADARVAGGRGDAVERGRLPGHFHHLVVEAAGNRLMTGLYGGIMAALRSAIATGAVVDAASPDVRHDDHAAILAALEAADAPGTARAMLAHAGRDLVVAPPA
ncbi:FadR/GntR family transcriptional regulator [Cellulomonas sp. HZM]|uniref:FadR/GntR family transcriptional regulator n=1 Tax=Cellulomonas sp. HZM TaxID=1454010 RepID=UPI00068C96BD|nr:FCD domain-containing protein [Cellulomonas sp. HZM]